MKTVIATLAAALTFAAAPIAADAQSRHSRPAFHGCVVSWLRYDTAPRGFGIFCPGVQWVKPRILPTSTTAPYAVNVPHRAIFN